MGLTGKYDFPGIQKLGRAGALAFFASTGWLSWIPGGIRNGLVNVLTEILANKILVVLNDLGYVVNGKIDSAALGKALNEGIDEVDRGGVTPERGAEIDQAVMDAADKALPYGRKPSKPK